MSIGTSVRSASGSGRLAEEAYGPVGSQTGVRCAQVSSVKDGEDLARKKDRTRRRPRLWKPLRRLRDGLSRAAGWVRDRARASARAIKYLLTRAVGWVRDKIRSAARRIKSLFLATIGEDRGFGSWWLVVTAAVALAIGLLVAVLLSPIIGILAALVVGIWMLVRRSRSSQSRQAAKAGLAN